MAQSITSINPPNPKPEFVTEEAHRLIRGERARHYGPPHDNFAVIAELWYTYLRGRFAELGERAPIDGLDGNDVCNLMSLLKVAREATGNGYHRDSTVDVIGYQAIKEALQTPREEFIKQLEPRVTLNAIGVDDVVRVAEVAQSEARRAPIHPLDPRVP